MTPEGIKGEVQSVNVLRQLVKVIMDVNDEKEIREYKVERGTGVRPGNRNGDHPHSVKGKDAGRAFYRAGDSGTECRDGRTQCGV